MSDSGILDFDQWGGLKSDGRQDGMIPKDDGVHRIIWNESEIIYKISKSHLLEESETVLVGLNAAISKRSEKNAPFFTGGGKATSIDAPIISISDPGTHFGDVSLAWYLGTVEDTNYQRNLAEFLESFCIENNLLPILFGGSGGGFAALVLSKMIEINSLVLAMNPQTCVLDWYQGPLENLYTKAWKCSTKEEFKQTLENSGINYEFINDSSDNSSKVLILQNLFDDYHMIHHFPRISKQSLQSITVSGSENNVSWFFGCWGFGHYAPWPNHVRSTLTQLNQTLDVDVPCQTLVKLFYPKIDQTNFPVHPKCISLTKGGDLGDFEAHIKYQARSDLPSENIRLKGYNFSKFESKDRNLAFCVQALRQIDRMITTDDKIVTINSYIALYHLLSWDDFANNELGKNSEMLWYDMAAGLRAQKIGYLLSLANHVEGFSIHKDRLTQIAKRHIKEFQKPGYISMNNHGIFVTQGYMSIGRALGEPQLIDSATKLMQDRLEYQYTHEMVHVENSPEYHTYITSIFQSYFRMNWYGEAISEKLKLARVNAYWLNDTNDRFLTIGDSEPMPQSIDSALKKNATASSDLQFNHDEQEYFVKSFESTGYLSLKSERPNGSTLFSLSAFVDIGHRHADDFSFVLQDSGKWIFIDPGKYTYDRNERHKVINSWQHNCFVIDQESYPTDSSSKYESCRENYGYDEGGNFFHTSTRKVWKTGVEHHRKLIYAPGEFFVVIDNAKSPSKRNYSQWFQLDFEIENVEIEHEAVKFGSAKSEENRIWFESVNSSSEVNKFRADDKKNVGWGSRKYQNLEHIWALQHQSEGDSVEMIAFCSLNHDIDLKDIKKRIDYQNQD